MKKVFLFIVLAAMFTTTATNATAQNRCVLKNGNSSQKVITYSDDIIAFQHNDRLASFVTKAEVKTQVKGNAPTHTLNVYPPAQYNWDEILVSDGTTAVGMLFPGMGDTLTVELEEGTYYVASLGLNTQGYICTWTYDGFELNADMDIYVDFDDCVYDLNVDIEDENGNPLNVEDVEYHAFLSWQNVWTFSYIAVNYGYNGQMPFFRFNGFDEGSSLHVILSIEPGNQKSYLIKCPDVTEMHESQTFVITAEDMSVFEEMFTVRNDYDTHYYHADSRTVIDSEGSWIQTSGWGLDLIFDTDKPYTIVTNGKAKDLNNFEAGSKTMILPTVYEWINPNYTYPEYYDCIRTSLYIDDNGDLVREALPFFRDAYPNSCPASFPNWFPETPARSINPSDKIAFFGERTPLATYFPAAFNANNTPVNQNFFYGLFFFSGEQSCERACDYDTKIRVYVNDESIYNDSIYKFNFDANDYQFDTPVSVSIDALNTHLMANDVIKMNLTHVEFDLEKNDAMPPTMTFLRVLDGNGDETVWHDNLSQSTLVFGCADFTYHFLETEWGGYYDHLEYNAKPEVELLYSLDGETWEPLAFAEDESLFHIDYGNVFVAELRQLESHALNKWVSLQFILTDEAGNMQSQLMQNVFYDGEMVSVNEQTAKNIQHDVYPNPFTNEVKITAAQAVEGEANIAVYNVLGEQIYSKTYNCAETKEFIIDGSTWKSGVYFYSICTEDGVLQGKIIKE